MFISDRSQIPKYVQNSGLYINFKPFHLDFDIKSDLDINNVEDLKSLIHTLNFFEPKEIIQEILDIVIEQNYLFDELNEESPLINFFYDVISLNRDKLLLNVTIKRHPCLELVKFSIRKGYHIEMYIIYFIQINNISCLRICLEFNLHNRLNYDFEYSIEAVKHGSLECLKCLIEYSILIPLTIYNYAIKYQKEDILQYLLEIRPFPLKKETFNEAILSENDNIIKMLIEAGCPYDEPMEYAIRFNKVSSLKNLHHCDRHFLLSEYEAKISIQYSQLDCLRYILFNLYHDYNIPLDNLYLEAITNNKMRCLICIDDFAIFTKKDRCKKLEHYMIAKSKNYHEILEYLKEECWPVE